MNNLDYKNETIYRLNSKHGFNAVEISLLKALRINNYIKKLQKKVIKYLNYKNKLNNINNLTNNLNNLNTSTISSNKLNSKNLHNTKISTNDYSISLISSSVNTEALNSASYKPITKYNSMEEDTINNTTNTDNPNTQLITNYLIDDNIEYTEEPISTKNNIIVVQRDFLNGYIFKGSIFISQIVNYSNIDNLKQLGQYSSKTYTYKGELVLNRIQGYGILEYNMKYIYEGFFYNDKFHGIGIIKYLNSKDEYQGEFNEGKKTGYGIYKWKDGSLYTGKIYQNQFHGQGEYYNSNGVLVYSGFWKYGMMSGYGEYRISDSKKFIGKYLYDLILFFILYYTIIIGFFNKNKFEGLGIITNDAYTKYFMGFFKNNKQDGIGKIISTKTSSKNNINNTNIPISISVKYGILE